MSISGLEIDISGETCRLGVGGLSRGQGRQPAAQVPAVQRGEADREQGAKGHERAPVEQDQAVVQVGGASGERIRREAQQAEEEGEAQRAEQQGQRPAQQLAVTRRGCDMFSGKMALVFPTCLLFSRHWCRFVFAVLCFVLAQS